MQVQNGFLFLFHFNNFLEVLKGFTDGYRRTRQRHRINNRYVYTFYFCFFQISKGLHQIRRTGCRLVPVRRLVRTEEHLPSYYDRVCHWPDCKFAEFRAVKSPRVHTDRISKLRLSNLHFPCGPDLTLLVSPPLPSSLFIPPRWK